MACVLDSALTNIHKLDGFKQQKCILSQFWSPEFGGVSVPEFGGVSVPDFGHSKRCVVISHCLIYIFLMT